MLGILAGCGTSKLYDKIDHIQNVENVRDVHATVIDKLGHSYTRIKSTKIYNDFILVMKENSTGKVFSLTVTPATFATNNPGDQVYFKNINKEVFDEPIKNTAGLIITMILLFFVSCILVVVAFTWSSLNVDIDYKIAHSRYGKRL